MTRPPFERLELALEACLVALLAPPMLAIGVADAVITVSTRAWDRMIWGRR